MFVQGLYARGIFLMVGRNVFIPKNEVTDSV